MKRRMALGVLVLLFAATAVADEITFNFFLGSPNSLTASAAGLTTGPAMNATVSDTTTFTSIPQAGVFNASTGSAVTFLGSGGLVIASYTGGGGLVSIVNGATTLVSGTMRDNGGFLAHYPDGTGAFLGQFNVTAVDPGVLALFGLLPGFDPLGTVSITFAHDNFDGTTVTGVIGGGTVTIETPVPEPVGLGVLGMGLLAITQGLRRWLGLARAQST